MGSKALGCSPLAMDLNLLWLSHGTSSPPAAAREGLKEAGWIWGGRVTCKGLRWGYEGEEICTNRLIPQQSTVLKDK